MEQRRSESRVALGYLKSARRDEECDQPVRLPETVHREPLLATESAATDPELAVVTREAIIAHETVDALAQRG